MRKHGSLEKDEETNKAAWEATRGAITGAALWGVGAGIGGFAAAAYSPMYRGLTLQFRVYLQMSAMILGGMISADKRIKEYEQEIRFHKRQLRHAELWKQSELEFEELSNLKPKA